MITEHDNREIADRGAGGPFLRHIKVRNFKSIGKCAVDMRPLTVLVGRNGSGKSNFIDSLRFLVDGLRTSLDHAVKWRGGINEVRRRSTDPPHNFAIELEIDLLDEYAVYGFEIAAQKSGGFLVKRERLTVFDRHRHAKAHYTLENNNDDIRVEVSSQENVPPAASDRLYLVTASAFPEFRRVYDALLSMGFYNLNPQIMKEPQSPDGGDLLDRDGRNISSVVARIAADRPPIMDRIKSYLSSIVPEITDVSCIPVGPRETLLFRQKVAGSPHPWKFYAASVSDGTLRALGTLVAVAQLADRKTPVRLVGIEEPEVALHPYACGALIDALREATAHTQVVITTHSPDLLDGVRLTEERLLAVHSLDGDTKIAPVDRPSQQAIRDHLYTPGDLLRMNQLVPDKNDLERQEQTQLFDAVGEVL